MASLSLIQLVRRWVFVLALPASALLPAKEASAVLLYATAARNTAAPAADDGLDGWNLQGQWGSYLATPIAPQYFLAAQHIGMFSSITVGSQTYQVDTSFHGVGYADDPGSDLRVVKILGQFSNYAPLYTSADGSEFDKTITVFGRGTQRGDEVNANGTLRGWMWGSSDGVQSWGKNVVSGFANYNATSANSLLAFDFNSNGIASECALSVGDSSGGVFILSGGQWKLAGINYAVDGPWKITGQDTEAAFDASIFNAKNLYLQASDGAWTELTSPFLPEIPGASYASRVSDRGNWIASVVPEPASFLLLASGVLALLCSAGVRGRKQRLPQS